MNSSTERLPAVIAVQYITSCRLPTEWGEFTLHGFQEQVSGQEHVALTMGEVDDGQPVLTRLHSECLTGDALFSRRCDCGSQLATALQAIGQAGRGALLYLRQEGRGIGLLNKIRAYRLQDAGADTVEANLHLGFPADARDFSLVRDMFAALGIVSVQLMTNNPEKIAALQTLGITVVERVPLEVGRNPNNTDYLDTKAVKLGHLFS